MDHLLATANMRNTFQINFDFVIAWQAIIISVILSFVTVWMSAWLPARKAAKMAAIDAIRGTGEVKIKAKNVRGGRLIGKLFGFEGTLAYKSLRRSRRNFRATVVSLTVSIILFIVAGYFGTQYKETTRLYYPGVESANVVGTFLPPEEAAPDKDSGEASEHQYNTLDSTLADEITQKLREYPNATVFGVGDNVRDSYNSYSTVMPEEALTSKMKEYLESNAYVPVGDGYSLPISFYVTDPENYAKLCERAGVAVGSNILVNYVRIPGDEGKSVFAPYAFTPQTLRLTNQYDHSESELPLHGELDIRDVPNELAALYVGNITVIVPKLDTMRYTWFAEAVDTDGFTDYVNKILHESITFPGSSEYIEVHPTLCGISCLHSR
jgi:putative ABC transport system permease protein